MGAGRGRGRPRHNDQLTPAEWRIADAVRHGLSNRQIAARQGNSPEAVKFHMKNILGKLGLADRRALKAWPGIPAPSALRAEEKKMATELQWGTLGQIARSVADIGAAEAFYRDVVQLPHLYTFGDLAFFDCGGVRLMLSAVPEQGPPSQAVMYFKVDDIHRQHTVLAERGAEFLGAPHMIHRHQDGSEEWMAFFNDNEGRPLALMSRTKAQG